MIFNSIDFLIFFPIVLAIYFVIPKKARYIWLLVASYYFYMSWNAKYALLILISTLVTYGCALFIEKSDTKGQRKAILWTGILINLLILAFFKYFNFLADNIDMLLSMIGVSKVRRFDILLPVGISFYTFQALGYMIDVYRGDIKAEKNPLRYALFVSFFPQLVAGPIERSKRLLSQVQDVENIKLWDYERIKDGAVLMLWGLFLKMVLADRAAIFVDTVYNRYWIYGSIELIVASILFALQIYCDFASYSIIAIGASKVMGFELMDNFNTPYMAVSVRDFWRRWHISLSTWFRDYLYIPLGGSRCSKGKNYINILITFLVSGLWHGADWSYVVWGGLHGVYQIVEKALTGTFEKLKIKFEFKTESVSYKLGQMIYTFILVDFAWIFFRASSIKDALSIIKRIIMKWNPWVLFDKSLYNCGLDMTGMHILLVAVIILVVMDIIRYKSALSPEAFLKRQAFWFRWVFIWGLMYMILAYGIYGPAYDAASFIYFQF